MGIVAIEIYTVKVNVYIIERFLVGTISNYSASMFLFVDKNSDLCNYMKAKPMFTAV